MAASYPGSVKTFTTRNAGDVIQPAHVNDLQDEVNAIESGLLNGTAPLNSSNSTVANLSVSGGSTIGAVNVSSGLTALILTATRNVSSGGVYQALITNFGSSNVTGRIRVQGRDDTSGNGPYVELHIRPGAGSDGWVAFTEETIADRWVIGIKNADALLYFASGSPGSNTTRMTLSAAGHLAPTSLEVSGAAPATPTIGAIYQDSIVNAWAVITHSAGSPAVTDDYNVGSVTDNGVGDTTVTFATALPAATYAAVATMVGTTNENGLCRIHAKATGSVRVVTTVNGTVDDRSFDVVCIGG